MDTATGAGDELGDEVFIEGARFFGYHGVHAEERALGQRFVVDVAVRTDLRAAGAADDLAQTISYSAVYKRVRAIVEGPPRALIEAVAEEIAAAVLADFPAARAVMVTLRIPAAPIRGATFDAVGVRVRRRRGEVAG